MKKLLIYIFVSLIVSTSTAGGNAGFAGAYLRTGLGARALSMGNTGIADVPNAYSAYYNPAAFGFIENKLAGLSHSFMSLDRRQNFISFSMKVPPEAGFSIAWLESGFGDLKSYNSIGQEAGEINHSANAVYFSVARRILENLSIGLSLKILFEYINDGTDEFDYSSSGVGFDLGLMYRFSKDLTLAYQAKDLRSQLKAQTDKIFERGGTTIDKFPVTHKLGALYHTPLPWLHVSYEFETSNKQNRKHHLGLEAVYTGNTALRTGFDGRDLTFGLGMEIAILGTVSFVDYAFVPSVIDEGSSHVFSWQVAF